MKNTNLILLIPILSVTISCSKSSKSAPNRDYYDHHYSEREYESKTPKDDYSLNDVEYESASLILSLPNKTFIKSLPVGDTLENYITSYFTYTRLNKEKQLEILGIQDSFKYTEYESKDDFKWQLLGAKNLSEKIQSKQTYRLILQKF